VHGPAREIEVDGAHGRQVDDDSAVADRGAGDVVAATADGDRQAVPAAELDRGGDVVGVGAPRDDRRPPHDHAVPDAPRRVVALIARCDDGAGQAGGEVGDVV